MNNQTNNLNNNYNNMQGINQNSNQNLNNNVNNYNNLQNNNYGPSNIYPNNQYYNQQFYQNNQINNKKSNKTLPLILGICFIVISCIVTFVIVNKDNFENTNKNEYEENTNNTTNNNTNNVTNTNTNTNTNSSTYTYSGFEFTKKTGYNYYTQNDMLVIKNSNFITMFTVVVQNLEEIKQNKTSFDSELKKQMQLSGYTVNDVYIKNISNKEVYVGELTYNNMNMSYFIFEADSNYAFTGMALNNQNTHSETNISETINLVSDATYVGGTNNYFNSFNFSNFNYLQ